MLQFDKNPQTGFLPMLSLVGSIAIALVVLNSYINSLNYGCANLVWPVVPSFIILQFGILGHWLLATRHAALWLQYTPYVFGSILIHLTGWWYLKSSYPRLATVSPLRFNRRQFSDMVGNSFWVYLDIVGAGIWVATDTFLITARFGPEIIPAYQYNFKLSDLATFVINSACLAAMPKVAIWLASSERATRERAITEILRLNKFQTFLGCSAALVYVLVNDAFMRLWMKGQNLQVPLLWQAAFAGVLAITGAGLTPNYVALRSGDRGIRVTGVAALISALLNFGLSFLAMELSPVLGMKFAIFGIALATVIAASVKFLCLGWFCARELGISAWTLIVKNWLLAVFIVSFAVLIRSNLHQDRITNLLLLVLIVLLTLVAIAWVAGVGWKDLREEKRIFQAMFRADGHKTAVDLE
jgi:O-antigen/teichoic acid export membrane protein